MNRPPPQLTGPRPGLLTRMLLAAGGAVMLVSAAFLGAFFFLAAIGIFAVLTLVLVVRGWRFKKRFEKAMREQGASQGAGPRADGRTTLEGEYVIITRRRNGEPGEGG